MGKITRLALLLLICMFSPILSSCGSSSSSTAPPGSANTWAWMSGSSTIDQSGNYGTQGVTESSNVPCARTYAASWIDSAGNLWLFGGWGYDKNINFSYFNDLWKFDVTNSTWTWVSGSDVSNQSGTYNTPGNNVPGARNSAVSWVDGRGNFWLFGGWGYDSTGSLGQLNDLWKFDVTNSTWTWMSGSDVVNQSGIYSTPGSNVPGARGSATSWIDGSGNLWLFGGCGYGSKGRLGSLNDLWKFDVTNSTWTRMSGSDVVNQTGIYSTPGSNVPGARGAAVSWIDGSGNLWLFGGCGYDSNGSIGYLNDLWIFDVTNSTWTWMRGSDVVNQTGIYSTPGSNVPGARNPAASWIDGSGNLWIFGGYGYDSNGTNFFNDLWKFDVTNSTWTWMSGSDVSNQRGTYSQQGVPASYNVPGARQGTVSWVDGSGNFWLFGGNGVDKNGKSGDLNDLWVYQP